MSHRRLALAVLAPLAAPALAQVTTQASVSSLGVPTDAHCNDVDISADGRWIVFESAATTLVPPDTNNRRDVFLHDTHTGQTTRVSIGFGGVETDHDSYAPRISPSGRTIAFVSAASNLLPVPVGNHAHVYLVERETGAIELADVDDAGAPADGPSNYPAMDTRADRVAFASFATNLGQGASGLTRELYVRDREAGTTQLISVDASGAPSGFDFADVEISSNGNTIVCTTGADNLGPADPSAYFDVYAYDLQAAVWSLVGASSAGIGGNHGSGRASVSGDGRLVAFESQSTNLHPADTELSPDVFVRDLVAGTTELVSHGPDGATGHGNNWRARISADGRFVYFHGTGPLLPTYATGGGFRRDRATGVLDAVSLGQALQMATIDQAMATSADGERVVFASWTAGLTPEDGNTIGDVFYRSASGCPPGTLLHPDADGDGFGDPARELLACGLSEGWVVDGTDCDDADAAVHPGAAESCNGLDEDCDLVADDGCVVVYCSAKPNSLGCLPTIGASASYASVSGPDDFVVQSTDTLSGQFGVFLWSPTVQIVHFGGGLLCVGSPLIRAGVQNSGGGPPGADCSGQFAFFFSQAYMAQSLLAPGDTVHGQFWSRDPGFAAPDNMGLTAGLQFQIGP